MPCPTMPPPGWPPASPLTLEERKAQLRDLFSQADRPLGAREIADTLGVKMGTVRSRIHRGRTQLRASLEAAAQKDEGAKLLLRTR